MDFQATWGSAEGDPGVSSDDPAADLVIAKANLTPSLDDIDPDTRDLIEEAAFIAGKLLKAVDADAGKRYSVIISGHITSGTEQATANVQVMSN